jgi:uncharacterized protein (DUF2225 family)
MRRRQGGSSAKIALLQKIKEKNQPKTRFLKKKLVEKPSRFWYDESIRCETMVSHRTHDPQQLKNEKNI